MPESVDLSSPARRREALRSVDVDDPRPHHALLREIFDLERAWRELGFASRHALHRFVAKHGLRAGRRWWGP